MLSSWPPTPSVEDEEVALAREHSFDASSKISNTTKPKTDDSSSTTNRGSVDQYPIILETPVSNPNKKKTIQATDSPKAKPNTSADRHSSDESNGPATPPPLYKKPAPAVSVPPSEPQPPARSPRPPVPRSKSSLDLRQQDAGRGRPQVSRIQTDVPSDLDGMVTGRRRAPSPYSYTPRSGRPEDDSATKQTFLTPPSATPSRRSASSDTRRAASAAPSQNRNHAPDSAMPDHPVRRPEIAELIKESARERPVAHMATSSKPSRPEVQAQPKVSAKDPAQTRTDRLSDGSISAKDVHDRHRLSRERITPPMSPAIITESPYNSSTEGTRPRRPTGDYRAPVTESPYTSSAEEGHYRRKSSDYRPVVTESPYNSSNEEARARHHRRKDTETHGHRSRRSSHHRHERPPSDYAEHRHSHKDEYVPSLLSDQSREKDYRNFSGPSSPPAPRHAYTMEDYLERAFENNHKRRSHRSNKSTPVSPVDSPPNSPPRTPKPERNSRGYFDTPGSVRRTKSRSRNASVDDDFAGFGSMTGLITAAIASKVAPALTRSSTASFETSSSSSHGKVSSGQRSRRSSPTYDERLNGSCSSSYGAREERIPPVRVSTMPAAAEDRPVIREGPPDMPANMVPRVAQRAFSYSVAPEGLPVRPVGPIRTASTAAPFPATPGTLQPSLPSRPGLMPSALSSDRVPTLDTIGKKTPLLPQCPRAQPQSGLSDWYTIQGMPHLDFCPSCMKVLGSSVYRNFFVPSLYKHQQPISCALSKPWIRVAWLQTLKQNRRDLRLFKELSLLPEGTRPCQGRKSDLRKFYHLTDLRTGKSVPNFDACSACLWAVDRAFPNLQGLFERPKDKLHQEKICNLRVDSKHFDGIIHQLDKLSNYRTQDGRRSRDDQAFVDYMRKLCRFKECSKNIPLLSHAWHYMPDLPEFTVCEDCYEEVVWPLANQPVAKDISHTTRLVPYVRQGQSSGGLTCQLYSERMRQIFQQAVAQNDKTMLVEAAKSRYATEHRVNDLRKLYEADMRSGYDRRSDLERIMAIWKEAE